MTKRLIITVAFFSMFGYAPCQVLDYKRTIDLGSNRYTETKEVLIQINNKEEGWLSDISIPYSGTNKVQINEAVIIDARGEKVRKLKKKEITTRSNIDRGFFFSDEYVQEFSLKWHQYPYKVKYSYTRSVNSFTQLSWYPFLNSNVITKNASFKLTHPADYKAKMYASEELKYTKSNADNGSIIHNWSITNLAKLTREALSPPLLETLPHVLFVPTNFRYAIAGNSESWSSFGLWQDRLNEGMDQLPLYEAQKVERLVEGISDKREVIKTLYHYMQDQTRYVYVGLDVGGLKPYPASYVCEKKYGDCKALTIYMKAILKHVNIPSYYTLVYAGDNPVRLNQNLPTQQFNHVILAVPLENDTIWLENTLKYLPYNYLGTFTQNRRVLYTDEEKSKLIKTPSLTLDEVLVKNEYEIILDDDGNGEAKLNYLARGNDFETLASYKQKSNDQSMEKLLKRSIKLKKYSLEDWSLNQKNRDTPEIEVNMQLELSDQFRIIGDIKIIQPFALDLFELNAPGSRKAPLRINCPVHIKDIIHYKLQDITQYNLELPQPISIVTSYGSYHYEVTEDDGQIKLERTYQVYSGDYSLEEYSEFYDFIQSVKKSERQLSIILNPKNE